MFIGCETSSNIFGALVVPFRERSRAEGGLHLAGRLGRVGTSRAGTGEPDPGRTLE